MKHRRTVRSDNANEMARTVCPSCGKADQIDVAATVWVRITDNGTDADASSDGHQEYDGDSAASCGGCRWSGTLSEAESSR